MMNDLLPKIKKPSGLGREGFFIFADFVRVTY